MIAKERGTETLFLFLTTRSSVEKRVDATSDGAGRMGDPAERRDSHGSGANQYFFHRL